MNSIPEQVVHPVILPGNLVTQTASPQRSKVRRLAGELARTTRNYDQGDSGPVTGDSFGYPTVFTSFHHEIRKKKCQHGLMTKLGGHSQQCSGAKSNWSWWDQELTVTFRKPSSGAPKHPYSWVATLYITTLTFWHLLVLLVTLLVGVSAYSLEQRHRFHYCSTEALQISGLPTSEALRFR